MLEQLAAQNAGKATFLKAKIDDATEAASSLGVMGLPTIVFFKDGKEMDRSGPASKQALEAKLRKVTG